MKKVLFLCVKNSARSQMAEAILKENAGDRFEAYSAGSKPAKQVNDFAIRVMQEVNVDLSEKKPESAEKYSHVKFDFVITLCDKMVAECPKFSGDPIVAHWGMPDPDIKEGNDDEKMKEFRKARNEILRRITIFINLPVGK
jgi:protein-tyrosine-phosphatase